MTAWTLIALLFFAALFFAAGTVQAVEHVSLRRDGKPIHVSGQVVVRGQNGGLMLEATDGRLWLIQGDEIQEQQRDDQEFEPLDSDEIAERLLKEMPDGFRIHHTAHYVICYNTTEVYAEWCGALYERLYRGFYAYWKNQGWELSEPRFPLVGIVFDSKRSYAQYSRPELGDAVDSMIGYYNMRSNRVVMYDLTGIDGLQNRRGRINSIAYINQLLSRPEAERTVATIVHEATHQLAYNSGLQTRYADNPLWVSEGLAIFFESPDLKSSKGWRTIGAINHFNLIAFRKYLRTRPNHSLLSLVQDDVRFRDARHASSAYAEAWALNYFLLRTRTEEYLAYLKQLSQRTPLIELTPEQRVTEFREAFGDMDTLDEQFVRYMSRLR